MIIKSMVPVTNHHDFHVQMQINHNNDYAAILFGSKQENGEKSLTLKPGTEYEIELSMNGKKSTSDFQKLSLAQRNCRLTHEILQNATYKVYTKANCEYDCKVSLAFNLCNCIPVEFVNNINNAEKCDIFGKTCFMDMIENMTHSSRNLCPHCIDECDKTVYSKKVIKSVEMKLKHVGTSCNDYICGYLTK